MNKNKIETKLLSLVKYTLSDRGIHSVVLGLSGGTDSVALALLLKEAGVEVLCVHCNFHLRGQESDRDMNFVVSFCKENDMPLRVIGFDTVGYCERECVSLETGCRDLRYTEFRRIMSETGADRIAVAHHLDDNIETLFLNLFRGSGVTGLKAMTVDTGEILRPLLSVSRAEILEFLRLRKQDYVTDSTNADTDFRRNFIRNTLLPLIETRWTGVRGAIGRSIDILQDEARLVQKVVDSSLEVDGMTLKWQKAFDTGAPLTVICKFIARFGANMAVGEEIVRYFTNEDRVSGKKWLTASHCMTATRDALYVSELKNHDDLLVPGELPPGFELEVVANTEANRKAIRVSGPPLFVALPLPRLNYRFRHPKTGDRIAPIGMKGTSQVSDIMKDAHLTPPEKQNLWIVEEISSGSIIWVEGLKRSRHSLVDENSENIYIIRPRISK